MKNIKLRKLKMLPAILTALLLTSLIAACANAQTSPTASNHAESDSAPATVIKKDSFISKDGGFSIDLAQNYFYSQDLNELNFGKKVIGKIYAWKIQNLVYTVMFFEYSETANIDEEVKNSLTDASKGIRKTVSSHNGEIIYEKSIWLDNYPGLEIKYSANGVTAISRNYLVGKTAHQVTGIYRSKSDEESVLETLNTFELMKENK